MACRERLPEPRMTSGRRRATSAAREGEGSTEDHSPSWTSCRKGTAPPSGEGDAATAIRLMPPVSGRGWFVYAGRRPSGPWLEKKLRIPAVGTETQRDGGLRACGRGRGEERARPEKCSAVAVGTAAPPRKRGRRVRARGPGRRAAVTRVGINGASPSMVDRTEINDEAKCARRMAGTKKTKTTKKPPTGSI